jgi:thioredoxin 1
LIRGPVQSGYATGDVFIFCNGGQPFRELPHRHSPISTGATSMTHMFSLASVAMLPLAVLAAPAPAFAIERQVYSDAAFKAAQKAGKPILIEVHAPWCPVCVAQDRTIASLSAAHPDLMIFRIDYDSQKPLWTKFGAQKQSTLIAFRGGKETGRIAYVSDEASLAKLLASTRG